MIEILDGIGCVDLVNILECDCVKNLVYLLVVRFEPNNNIKFGGPVDGYRRYDFIYLVFLFSQLIGFDVWVLMEFILMDVMMVDCLVNNNNNNAKNGDFGGGYHGYFCI